MIAPRFLPAPPEECTVEAVASRSILRKSSPGGRFWPCAAADFTINPYRGCQIGCVYCHARYTHEYLELGSPFWNGPDDRGTAWQSFERRILFKSNAADLLCRELTRLAEKWPERDSPPSVALGTVTDPYQPLEERLRVTRGILEALVASSVKVELRINTKSDLILRDLDLLQALSRRGPLQVNLTITTLDHDLARALEPRAPPPRRRLMALGALSGAGLRTGVLLMPLIPGVNDGEEEIGALAREARARGALYLSEAPLLLPPSAWEPFFRFLRRRYPQLERAYREAFGAAPRAPESYREKIRRRAAHARKTHSLLPWPPGRSRRPLESPLEPRRPSLEARTFPRQLEIPGI